jgi:hypothetical protein
MWIGFIYLRIGTGSGGLVNTVMNLEVLQTTWKFMTGGQTY